MRLHGARDQAADRRYIDVQYLLPAAVPSEFVEGDCARHGDVQRLAAARLRDRGALLATLENLRRQAFSLGAEHEHDIPGAWQLGQRDSAARHERTRFPGDSSNPLDGTRKSEPIEARTAFEPLGSAQPSDSATPAPNASAARSSVPTLPGSPTCQSASVTGRTPRGRSRRRKTATTRGGCESVDTPASSSAATSSPATSTSTGSSPAARPASTRSSPSTANSPSLSRQRRSWSLRTSLSRSLSREVISWRARLSPARRSPRTRPGR
jgi:hypothetical protein